VSELLQGFQSVLSMSNILIMIIGIITGIIVGALPGLTATMAVALITPLTFGMSTIPAMLLLLGVYCAGIYGGSITAILIHTPGTPSSAATILDGYPMVQKGKSRKALEAAIWASSIAGLISTAVLTFIAPQVAKFALRFGPQEYFALAFFGLTMIISVSSESIIKGIISTLVGLLSSAIGLGPIIGLPRFTLGINSLTAGISLVPALVGLFAIGGILAEGSTKDSKVVVKENIGPHLTFLEIAKALKTVIKSSMIGTFIGALPGTGSAIASFLSYGEAKRSSKNGHLFGTGYYEGVMASEAGNNGVTGATLIPTLTLGIPGDTITAVLLGALMIHGLSPGPKLFRDHREMMFAIFAGLFIINIIMLFIGLFSSSIYCYVINVPKSILHPIIIMLCFLGVFSVSSRIFDVFVMMIFGIIGYFFITFRFPLAPLLLGLVLGPIIESNLRRSLILSGGSMQFIIERPITLIIMIFTIIGVFIAIKKLGKKL
jgi:putative tricarboxylic transport membrane protein